MLCLLNFELCMPFSDSFRRGMCPIVSNCRVICIVNLKGYESDRNFFQDTNQNTMENSSNSIRIYKIWIKNVALRFPLGLTGQWPLGG